MFSRRSRSLCAPERAGYTRGLRLTPIGVKKNVGAGLRVSDVKFNPVPGFVRYSDQEICLPHLFVAHVHGTDEQCAVHESTARVDGALCRFLDVQETSSLCGLVELVFRRPT